MNSQVLRTSIIKCFFLTIAVLLTGGCHSQDYHVKEIFTGVKIEHESYVYSEESLYSINDQSYSLRNKAIYDDSGRISKLFIYKSDGTLEYSADDLNLSTDKKILEITGFPFNQRWTYAENSIFDGDTKVAEVTMSGENILMRANGNRVTFYRLE